MHFSKEEQDAIRIKMFEEGIGLLKQYGVQRLTIDKLTHSCGIAKGSFYNFYESKETYLYALMEYAGEHIQGMLVNKLAGRKQMTTHEFFEFFREYLYSDYDLLRYVTIEDFLWMQKHLSNMERFQAKKQLPELDIWLSLMSDVRTDIDKGVVVNLIKSIYAMREVKANLIQESLDDTIEFMLVQIERYIAKPEIDTQ